MYLLIKISKKELHKINFDNANNDDIDMKYYTVWLKYSKTLFRHEGNLSALTDRNSTYSVFNKQSEICKTSKLSTDHMDTRCKRFLGNKYVVRQDNILRVVIFNMLRNYKIIKNTRIRNFKFNKEYANKDVDIRVDKHIITDCNVKFNKADLTIIDKKTKTI